MVFQIYQERRGHVFIRNKEYENLILSLSNFLFFSLMNDCPPFVAVRSLGHAWLFVTPRGCSTLGFPVLHYLLEFVQTHAHWVDDAIQPSHSLSPPSPPALNLSQHQGLFQWVGFLTFKKGKKWSPLVFSYTVFLLPNLFLVGMKERERRERFDKGSLFLPKQWPGQPRVPAAISLSISELHPEPHAY